MKYNGTVVNIDSDSPWYFINDIDGDYSNIKQKAENFVEGYWNKGITDLVFCVFCQASESFTNTCDYRGDKYYLKTENGIAVDYTNHERILPSKLLKDKNIDIFDIWIKHTKKGGINPWISVRMNDCHLWDAETSFLRPEFFYEARKNGWLLPFGNVFNYAVPQVREMMLKYIEEQILRYDVYGLELDFTREMVYFDYKNNPECYLIMNDFLAEVKRFTATAEEKHGHSIKIMVRVSRDMVECKEYGLDVLTWAKEGFIDAVVPSAHWATTDSDMPIDKWLEALSPHNISVYAGLELNLNHWVGLVNNFETLKGMTVQYSAIGSQKIYLYNYFLVNKGFQANCPLDNESRKEIWRVCSDEALARKGVRRHVMTEQDDNTDRGYKGWEPLPKKVDGTVNFNVLTGEILKDEKATLYIGIDGDESQITVNGKEYSYSFDTKEAYIHISEKCKCEKVLAVEFTPDETLKRQSVEISSKKGCTVKYIEIKVIGS